MNQLAAKYLKNGPPVAAPQRIAPRPATAPIDMSFATRNYMERHKLLKGMLLLLLPVTVLSKEGTSINYRLLVQNAQGDFRPNGGRPRSFLLRFRSQ